MQSIPMQSTPAKDRRRILGEKDANACLSPSNRKDALSATGTPVKRALFAATSPKKLLPSPIFAGQKRTRDQADEADVNSGPVQVPRSETAELSHEPNSHSTPIHDSQSQPTETADAMDVHLLPHHQQEQHDPTHDDLNANESSTLSQSPEKSPCIIPENPDARKMFIQEKAILLRSRIQNAMRNVTDHQFDRRVSELEAHSRKCPRLSLSALSTPPLLGSRRATTPSQTKTPRLGCTANMSSAPSHNTPGLPAQPFPASTSDEVPYDASQTLAVEDTPPRDQGSPMHLSSPPAPEYSRTEDQAKESKPEGGEAPEEIRPPSQRGDAVDALLKLMSTADRHDSSDTWSG